MKIEGNVLTPDEGNWLTNGEVYSLQVWLGINDSPDNWHDILDKDVPDEWKETEAVEE